MGFHVIAGLVTPWRKAITGHNRSVWRMFEYSKSGPFPRWDQPLASSWAWYPATHEEAGGERLLGARMVVTKTVWYHPLSKYVGHPGTCRLSAAYMLLGNVGSDRSQMLSIT